MVNHNKIILSSVIFVVGDLSESIILGNQKQ